MQIVLYSIAFYTIVGDYNMSDKRKFSKNQAELYGHLNYDNYAHHYDRYTPEEFLKEYPTEESAKAAIGGGILQQTDIHHYDRKKKSSKSSSRKAPKKCKCQ